MSDPVYRERAHLVAHLAAVYRSALVYGADPEYPDWPIVFIHTGAGQLSWHISPEDEDLFGHVEVSVHPNEPAWARWDGHSTDEKYERLQGLNKKGLSWL